MPTYLVSFVKVDHAAAMRVTTVASALNVAFIAIPAWVSDAVGRKPVLIAGCLGFVLLIYPFYVLLSSGRMGFNARWCAWVRRAGGVFHGAIHDGFDGAFFDRGPLQWIRIRLHAGNKRNLAKSG